MKTLTEKQKDILNFIEDFMEKDAMAPTVYEIADFFKIKTSTVFAHFFRNTMAKRSIVSVNENIFLFRCPKWGKNG